MGSNRVSRFVSVGLCLVAIQSVIEAREISFDERVQARTAIERFYWTLREWPQSNPGAKPSFDEVLSTDRLRAEVTDSLRKAEALRERWGVSFTPGEVQAEIDRMARDSRNPDALRALWAELHRDPLLIAESLARPRIVDREIHARFARDPEIHAETRRRAEVGVEHLRALESPEDLDALHAVVTWARASADGQEPIAGVVPLDPEEWDELWSRLALPGESSLPAGRLSALEESDEAFSVAQVLEQHDDILQTVTVTWPKTTFDAWWAAARETVGTDPATDDAPYDLDAASLATCDFEWRSLTDLGAPSRRQFHSAVWTGSEMIVWGGRLSAPTTDVNTGGRYDPITDSWTPTSTIGPPLARSFHTAVWTGEEMIVWGGQSAAAGSELNTGGRYNPTTDTWRGISLGANSLTPRSGHTAVWTGEEMIVWGGSSPGIQVGADGARYVPATDHWLAMPSPGPFGRRSNHGAVWTGRFMIVWGGSYRPHPIGEAYDPSFGWSGIASPPVPLETNFRIRFSTVWTGTEMIVWGGNTSGSTGQVNDGGRYDPATNSWTLTSTGAGVPERRESHTAVWTGTEMIVWGGDRPFGPIYDSGGRYDPTTDSWTPTSLDGGVPTARTDHTALWTGDEMIVWGGRGNGGSRADGARYVRDLCDDGDACTTSDRCAGNVCLPGPPLDCNDGNNCTDDPCDSTIGCANTSNGTCTGDPNGQGYWRSLCRGPHASEFISPFDIACVNDSCTFATVDTVSELCRRLDPDPPNDKCEQAEAQLLTLLLNECRTRVSESTAVDHACDGANGSTVGQSIAEADELLCDEARTRDECTEVQCIAEGINSGDALHGNSLRLEREAAGVRLTWDAPFGAPGSVRYVVSRASLRNGDFAPLAETSHREFVDPEGNTEDFAYDVRAVW